MGQALQVKYLIWHHEFPPYQRFNVVRFVEKTCLDALQGTPRPSKGEPAS